MIPGGIALEMTECDVVKRAGAPEQVELGTNERGERTVVADLHARPAARHLSLRRRPPEVDRAGAGAAGRQAAPKAQAAQEAARPTARRADVASAPSRRFEALRRRRASPPRRCASARRVFGRAPWPAPRPSPDRARTARRRPARHRAARSRAVRRAISASALGDPPPQRRELDAPLRGGAAGFAARVCGLRLARRAVLVVAAVGEHAAAGSRRDRRRTASTLPSATSQSRSAQASSRWRSCDTRITAPG